MRKNTVNEKFFKDINECSAYWAGFIAADGCITKNLRRLAIHLKDSDYNHLERFRIAICYSKQISILERVKKYGEGKIYKEARLEISSKEFCSYLIDNFNILPRKSFNYKPPELDDRYLRFFLLGYFDGDGCFCTLKRSNTLAFKVIGSIGIIELFHRFINKNCNLDNTICKQGPVYTLRYNGKSAIKIGEELYKNSVEFGMRRKYEKWKIYV